MGGHPLAGAARSGIEFGSAGPVQRAPVAADARRGTPAAGVLEKLSAFVAGLHAVPRVMDAEDHDHLLAMISHVPQLAASALMHVIGEAVGEEGLALAGRGLRDTTRLASSGAEVWTDVTTTNADAIGTALDTLIDVLVSLRRDLHHGDRLADVFASAQAWRHLLEQRVQR